MKFLIELLTNHLNPNLENNETEIHSGEANLFRHGITVGGKLFLTDQRLIFLPHKLNLSQKEELIDLGDINTMEEINSLDWLNNTLIIKLKNNTEFKFLLYNSDVWVAEINNINKVNNLIDIN